ncbi:nuclear transport factor 2 family protein [Nonomuraea sp. B12E4]|uniref:nuclear transport factor 2 family protein n=1 Tax=Nonomuraea sp. B12E4 TaxID=3153564 RepID=UPI00325F6FF3
MSISDTTRSRVVDAFACGWRKPHPHAWDELLAPDVHLEQPFLESGHGRSVWHRGVAQLLALIPDLAGVVHGWAGDDDTLYIDVELTGTIGGRSLSVRAIDRLTLDGNGLVTARRSYLNPLPLAAAIAARPTAWPRWWRSGLPPFSGRTLGR